MFVAVNRLKAKQGRGQDLEARFAESQGVTRQPGFLSFELLKRTWGHAADDAEEYLVMTRWRSREDHDAWVRSEAFRRAHAGPPSDFLLGPGEPAGYEVRISRGPDPATEAP